MKNIHILLAYFEIYVPFVIRYDYLHFNRRNENSNVKHHDY